MSLLEVVEVNAFVNKVEGMRTKWLNDPMKQAFAGDLKKLVDLFQPNFRRSQVISNLRFEPEVQHVKVDQEFQAVWESGVSYMYKLAVEYLFLCDSFILKVVGRTTADGTTMGLDTCDDDKGYQGDDEDVITTDYQDSEDLKKSQDIPKIYERQPKLHEIDRIECNGKVVKVIEMSAAKWEKIATRLYFEPQHIETIKRDSHKSEEACRNVFVQWLEGGDYVRKPLTWKTLITVLTEAKISNTAGDLEIVLKMISSQNAEQ